MPDSREQPPKRPGGDTATLDDVQATLKDMLRELRITNRHLARQSGTPLPADPNEQTP